MSTIMALVYKNKVRLFNLSIKGDDNEIERNSRTPKKMVNWVFENVVDPENAIVMNELTAENPQK